MDKETKDKDEVFHELAEKFLFVVIGLPVLFTLFVIFVKYLYQVGLPSLPTLPDFDPNFFVGALVLILPPVIIAFFIIIALRSLYRIITK